MGSQHASSKRNTHPRLRITAGDHVVAAHDRTGHALPWRRLTGPGVASAVIAVVCIGGAATLTAGPAAATSTTSTVQIHATADTYSAADSPRTVRGTATKLVAGNQPRMQKVSYLRFRVPAASGATLSSAVLTLTRNDHHLAGSVRAVRVSTSAWSERTLVSASAPRLGSVLSARVTGTRTKTVSLAVTAVARLGSDVTIGITSSLTNGVASFQSRESRVGVPVLTLTLVKPAPHVVTSSVPAPSTSSASPSTSAAAPSTSAAAPAAPGCSLSTKLVPSCGHLWGVSPKRYTSIPLETGMSLLEQEAQTPFSLVHEYHVNDQLFPTAAEQRLAMQPGHNRVLFLNWKPATDMSWAAVAAGKADGRIDRLANYIHTSFPYPFLLTIWHEPENDVNQSSGSGMTATDYAAMFRHVVLRLRADGATKPVIVMTYMGFDNWARQSWFDQLWPGSDVVDWIGLDPYGSGDASGYLSGDFAKLINRPDGSFPGYYSWATTRHPGTPIIVAEWGIYERTANPDGKARYFDSVSREMGAFPAVKALAYFDYNQPGASLGNTSPDSSAISLAGFRRLSQAMDTMRVNLYSSSGP